MKPTIASIIDLTAAEFGTNRRELLSIDRHEQVAMPRRIAMFLARELTGHSYPMLARHFRRDHTTVLVAVRHAELKFATDPDIHSRVLRLIRLLRATLPRDGRPTPAIGHIPFVGHRNQKQVRLDEERRERDEREMAA